MLLEISVKNPIGGSLSNLRLYYHLRSQLISSYSQDLTAFSRVDKRLKEIEKEHSISVRWSPRDKEYVESERALAESKRKQLLMEMWRAAKRRMFLLKLKSKYADGQKIAKRLAGQIGKEAKAIKELLKEFNMCCEGDGDNMSITIMAMDPSFLALKCDKSESLINTNHQQEIEAYLMICRCKEELLMLESEADNVIQFYEAKQELIRSELSKPPESKFNFGARCLLHK